MELETFQYVEKKGWSVPSFPELDSHNTLVLIFASPVFKDNLEPIHQLRNAYKKSIMIGCSTAGEIFGSKILDKTLSVSVIQFKNTPIKFIKTKITTPKDSFSSGAAVAYALNKPNLNSVFILSEGINVDGAELIRGLNKNINEGVIVTGGLAGDGSDFKNTWVIANGKILENHTVAVGFYDSHLRVGYAFKGGWDIFGPERRITRSKGNVLYELDNRPALSLYKEYLGERAKDLPFSGLLYPLSIRNPTSKERTTLVRTIMNIDEKKQALIFAGDMPIGYYAQLMRANFDRLITSASEAAELANHYLKKSEGPVLGVDISCVGRRFVLGERTEEETEATFHSLPEGSMQVGFYSYGELSPSVMGNCELHNQTMTITTFYEQETIAT